MTTLSLSCSRKIYELLGDTYETEKYWVNGDVGYGYEGDLEITPSENWNLTDCKPDRGDVEVSYELYEAGLDAYSAEKDRLFSLLTPIPAPSFSETIRLLPKIAEKKGWKDYVNRNEDSGCGMWDVAEDLTCFFVEATTEAEAMAKVSEYLEKML